MVLSPDCVGIPYPQLHALGWHCGVTLGLHLLTQLMKLQTLVVEERRKGVRINWTAGGIVPWVSVLGIS